MTGLLNFDCGMMKVDIWRIAKTTTAQYPNRMRERCGTVFVTGGERKIFVCELGKSLEVGGWSFQSK